MDQVLEDSNAIPVKKMGYVVPKAFWSLVHCDEGALPSAYFWLSC